MEFGLGCVVVVVLWIILFICLLKYRHYLLERYKKSYGSEEKKYFWLHVRSDNYLYAWFAGVVVSMLGCLGLGAQSSSTSIFSLLLRLVGFGIGGMIAVKLLFSLSDES